MGVAKPFIVGFNPTTADHAPIEFGLAISRLTGAGLIVVSVQSRPPLLSAAPPGASRTRHVPP